MALSEEASAELRLLVDNGGRMARENLVFAEELLEAGVIKDAGLDSLWRPVVELVEKTVAPTDEDRPTIPIPIGAQVFHTRYQRSGQVYEVEADQATVIYTNGSAVSYPAKLFLCAFRWDVEGNRWDPKYLPPCPSCHGQRCARCGDTGRTLVKPVRLAPDP